MTTQKATDVPAIVAAAVDHSLKMGEIGVQVAAYLAGDLILNTWAGVADRATGRLVDESTLFPVFSVTKAVTATAVHIQADRGALDYEAPVAEYWPEFGTNGKAALTIRHVLTHRTGLPQMPPDVTPELMCDWSWMTGRLAEMEPLFEPGTRSAYQSANFGWIAGEVVVRTDPKRRPFRDFVLEEITQPLQIDDLWLGIPAEDEERVARLEANYEQLEKTQISLAAVPPAVAHLPFVWNRPDVHRSCLPSNGGIMTAASAARFFAMLANGGELDGVRILAESTVDSLSRPREHADEVDAVLQAPQRIGIGALRYAGPPPGEPVVGNNARTLFHPGAGGSIGWADRDTGLAAAICHNRMFNRGAMPLAEHPFGPLGDAIRQLGAEATSTPVG